MAVCGVSDQNTAKPPRRFDSRLAEWILLLPLTVSGIVFGWFAFQPDPPDPNIQIAADVSFIGESELKGIAAFQAIANEVRAGTLTDLEAADRVERDVLPIWRQGRERVIAAREGVGSVYFPPELEEYFRLREESWEALVFGVRHQDPAAIERQNAKWKAADAVVAKLQAQRAAAAAQAP